MCRLKISRKIILLTALSMVFAYVKADTSNQFVLTNIKNLSPLKVKAQDPGTYIRGLKVFHDDILSNQHIDNVKLTPEQDYQAKVWGLTQNDERRYVLLMQNKSGLYWGKANLSPVEILGANARNPIERRRFALLYAKQSQERTAKELAWQAATNEAKTEINKGLPLIRPFDVTKFSPYNYHPINLEKSDELFLLTKVNLDVHRIISTLLADIQSNKNIRLNIYFSGASSDNSIQNWANDQNIPIRLVNKGEITINTNEGPFSHVKNKKTLPLLVLVRNNKAKLIDVSRF